MAGTTTHQAAYDSLGKAAQVVRPQTMQRAAPCTFVLPGLDRIFSKAVGRGLVDLM